MQEKSLSTYSPFVECDAVKQAATRSHWPPARLRSRILMMAPRGGMQLVSNFKALQREGRKRKRPSLGSLPQHQVIKRVLECAACPGS